MNRFLQANNDTRISRPSRFAIGGGQRVSRHGSALFMVLIVIVMLSLGAYTFSELMITEFHASDAYGRELQAHSWAASGVEYTAALLTADGGGFSENLYDNLALFHVPLEEKGGFTIVAPRDNLASGAGGNVLRYGLADECGRLNINVLAKIDPTDPMGHDMLMTLPYMTDSIADAILDWIDADTTARTLGAEAIDYTTAPPRDGPIDTLEELLNVIGMTPELLYGEDANRNGLLDPNENDGNVSMPIDNSDGILDLGWAQYLTVNSKEGNLRHSGDYYGEPRLNVNDSSLPDLYDNLEIELGVAEAQFIVAYRMNGPYTGVSNTSGSGYGTGSTSNTSSTSSGRGGNTNRPTGSLSGNSSGNNNNSTSGSNVNNNNTGGSNSGSSGSNTGASSAAAANSVPAPGPNPLNGINGSNSTSTTGSAQTDAQIANAAIQTASSLLGGQGGTITRGGMDLTNGGNVQIYSLYDLVDVQVQVSINGAQQVLTSPWSSSSGDIVEWLPALFDALSVSTAPQVEGRISVNQASQEVLAAVPGMPPELPSLIVSLRESHTLTSGTGLSIYNTNGWLLADGLTSIQTMRQIDGWLTGQGDVFRMQVIGHSDLGGPMSRIEAVVDATEMVPRIVWQRDLNDLGAGFHHDDLPTFGAP